jgi:chromosomal replication initiation ATPase DnaA
LPNQPAFHIKISAKKNPQNKTREAAVYLAGEVSGMSGKDLGGHFDGVSGGLITRMHNLIAEETAQNRQLNRRIEKTKKRILRDSPD